MWPPWVVLLSGAAAAAPTGATPELGVKDIGIFSDLDAQVSLPLPGGLEPAAVAGVLDPRHALLVLYVGGWPTKVYPLGGPATLAVGEHELALRPADRRELAGLLRPGALELARGAPRPGDRDGDGIPDPLDVLVGALKTALNADTYQGGYVSIRFPNGDVPRDIGVCTDVVVRAVRNAGIDLQAELQRDIRRARRAYPMVKRPDPSIDHRRVKTLLPYFKRNWEEHTAALDDPRDPLRPGDIVLFDTFPSRSGPDHIGVVSDHVGESGLPLVINNWTDGSHTGEMDLLSWVPVTHRFRIPAPAPRHRR